MNKVKINKINKYVQKSVVTGQLIDVSFNDSMGCLELSMVFRAFSASAVSISSTLSLKILCPSLIVI